MRRQHLAMAYEEPRRILVAEDDRALLDLIADTLRNDGYDVVEAVDGLELLARLEEMVRSRRDAAMPFVIVSDVRMPGLTGIEVLALLRRATWATPVILISAFADEEVCQEAECLGANAVLAKPFELDALRDAVREALPAW